MRVNSINFNTSFLETRSDVKPFLYLGLKIILCSIIGIFLFLKTSYVAYLSDAIEHEVAEFIENLLPTTVLILPVKYFLLFLIL